ncbi:MAG: ABC transporter ATP-binding protein [Armatimonadetes bacterium]|nr:ABC transporter ATP-binding protein [Armatimonadota bacterium]
MIQVNGLSKSFVDPKGGAVDAVADVSFACRAGEVLGLLGPNGAGKTTLLRMVSTLLTATSGTAAVAGWDIRANPAEVRARIGYLTGAAAPYDKLTPREMLAYFGALHGMTSSAVRTRTEELFERLDMASFADRRCERLSTGQRQRVNIARAVVHDPPVLLLDEPTAGLDVLAARTVMGFIRDGRSGGRAVLFSTHIMSEVETICDRVAVIHKGRLAAVGTTEELRARTGRTAFEQVFLSLIGEEESA